jgi:hypothetical protein
LTAGTRKREVQRVTRFHAALFCPLLIAMSAFTSRIARAAEPVPEAAAPTVAPSAIGAASTAAQANAPTTRKSPRSPFELRLIDSLLLERRSALEPTPDGKVVEGVEYARLEVLEERDNLPKFVRGLSGTVNALHATTRESVVARELLLREGDVFRAALADETERNLRRLSSRISIALVLPMRGSKPDRVRLLIVTKDVWSLRLSYDPIIGSKSTPVFAPGYIGVAAVAFGAPGAAAAALVNYGKLESLVLAPSETNVAGMHHTTSLVFTYLPESLGFGAKYSVPRFGTSTIAASIGAGFVVNQASGKPEGSSAAFSVGKPLYTTQTDWAWNLGGSYNVDVYRRYSKGDVFLFDSKKTKDTEKIRFEYDRRNFAASAGVTRSFGWVTKQDLSLGYAFQKDVYTTRPLDGIGAVARTDFLSRVPTTDTRSGPYASYRSYTSNYHRITDFETLGLQEDYRLGHDVYAQVGFSAEGLAGSRSFMSTAFGAQYTVPLGDGIARASFESSLDANSERIWDSSLEARLKAVTPRLGFGRFVFDGVAQVRLNNYLNRQSLLGGDTRLRGYPTRFFQGKDALLSTVEFRSRPWTLWTFQIGGAVFYDAGNVLEDIKSLQLKQLRHSAGIGGRLLIPQLNRVVFRADVSFPLSYPRDPGVAPAAFFMSFDQAVDFSGGFGSK